MALSSAKRASFLSSLLLITTTSFLVAKGFDISRSDNLVAYYGQNSYGATHANAIYSQGSLSTYCQDDTIDIIPLAFLHIFFSSGGLPEIDLANTCNSNNGNVFPGTKLAVCHQLADDIKTCQKRGKIVTMSLGGATGSTAFSSDAQAQTFAETVWNLFLGGSSDVRPFGDAVLDGVDLDLESGSGTGMAAFVTKLRELSNGASKRYYVTAAPQCPFPDAYMGSAISAVGFDAIFVQFYNNYCGINNYHTNAWNFGVWDNWAKNISPNKNIKVYIGAPAAESAANTGYVSAETLGKIGQETRSKYSSFGGIMLWDVSQAYGNDRYDVAVKKALTTGGPIVTTSTTTKISPAQTTSTTTKDKLTTTSTTTKDTFTTTSTTSKSSMTTPASTPGSCEGIANWDASAIYIHNNIVAYNGHKWTAKWWSLGDTPGGIVGVWDHDGPCYTSAKFKRLPRMLKN